MSMQVPPYETPNASYLVPPVRPTSVTVISVLGIIFGAVGCLCVVIGFGWQAASGQQQGGSEAMRTFGIVSGMAGLVLSIVLLIGSIGALSLRPWARATLLAFAVVDLMYDVGKLVIALVWVFPQMDSLIRNSPQVHANPNTNIEQAVKIGKAVGIGSTIATAAVTIAFALVVLIVMSRPKVKAAFEGPGTTM